MTPSFAVVKKPGHDTPPAQLAAAPAWLSAQMPAVYRSRFEEIQRLTAEIQGMDRMGRLLWDHGGHLRDAVVEALTALRTKPESGQDDGCLVVRIDATRRLLVLVAQSDGPLDKGSETVAEAFRVLQTTAEPGDRIVLVTTGQRHLPPQERGDTVSADAHDLLRRMGVNVLPTTMLFNVWMLSLSGPSEARACLELLHSQDGGSFKIKSK